MVTAMNGGLILRANSGPESAYNLYSSDVVGAYVTFSKNGAAISTSQNYILAPFDGYIADISTPATNTVATQLVAQVNDYNTGISLIANTLNTLTNRQINHTPFRKGDKLTLVQA